MSKKAKKIQKKETSPRAAKARAFFKRYWYWFATAVVLIGATLGWCAGMGLFEPDYSDEVPEEVSLFTFTYYKLPEKIGKYDANYSVNEEYADVVDVENGIIYSKKEGNAIINVSYGKATDRIIVDVVHYESRWTLGVGDEFTLDEVYGLANSLQQFVNRFDNSDTTVFSRVENADGSVKYVAAKQGLSILNFSKNDVLICSIYVVVKDNAQSSEKSVEKEKTLVEYAPFRKDPNVTLSKTLAVGDKFGISEIGELIGSGNIYFESDDPTVATVYQDGTVEAGMPGEAIVTVACVSDSGTTYYSVKYTVNVETVTVSKFDEEKEEDRNFRVGETLTEDDLFKFFYNYNIYEFTIETQYSGIFKQETIDGTVTFKALKSTGDGYVCITALSKDGKKIAVYKIAIDEKTEG